MEQEWPRGHQGGKTDCSESELNCWEDLEAATVQDQLGGACTREVGAGAGFLLAGCTSGGASEGHGESGGKEGLTRKGSILEVQRKLAPGSCSWDRSSGIQTPG